MKKKNIFYLLRQREYGHTCNDRLNLKVVRELVCEKGTTFKKTWVKNSKSSVCYEDGRLYFDNYRRCYTLSGLNGRPSLLYKLPNCPVSEKIQDGLVCSCCLERVPSAHDGWRSHFLGLTAHNWLLRLDLSSGRTLQQIYLSPKYKFRHLSWEDEQSTLVVKSTHIQSTVPVVNQNAVVAMAIFTVFPLEFVCMMEVTRSVFGRGCTDAMICSGTLVTFHSYGLVRIYSLEHILRAGLLYQAKLHQYCEQAHGVLGTKPTGLPLNLLLTEAPPVLFEVRCDEHNLTLGGIPWHYIIKTKHNFQVFSLTDSKKAGDGDLVMASYGGIEPDRCMFHLDNTGRILHIGADQVKVLELVKLEDEDRYTVQLDYVLHAAALNNIPKVDKPAIRYTSSGRAVKMRYAEEELPSETIAALNYENELDLLTVTSTHFARGDEIRGTVHFIDSGTGETIKDFVIKEYWNDDHEHNIIVDLTRIIHKVKSDRGVTVTVYDLARRGHCAERRPRRHSHRPRMVDPKASPGDKILIGRSRDINAT